MRHAEQVVQARRIFDYMAHRTTTMAADVYRHPVSDYVCPAQAAEERRRLFHGLPINLGLGCRIPAPGDYLTVDIAGVPLLLTRGREGQVHALMNLCRHRGARVAEGSGQGAAKFTCPYHAWSYGLDGRLIARPNDPAFAGYDKSECRLTALPVAERDGLLWVQARPGDAPDIDGHLAGLADEFAAYGFDRYHHYETRQLRRRINWKLVVDTFLETYHINVLHKNTIHPILHSDLAAFDGYGRNLRLIAPRRSIGEMRGQDEREWDLVRHSAVVYVLFPNTVFIMQGDHLETWHMFPAGDGVNESEMIVSFFIPEPATSDRARRHWDRNFDLLMATVEDEDFPVGEGAQAGFAADTRREIVFGRNEPALQHYHSAIRAALDAAA